jgi:hypothetical protein
LWVCERGKCRDAEIDADYGFRLLHRLHIVGLDHQADEPPAAFERDGGVNLCIGTHWRPRG